jgi:ABC-type sugar transport system ATPase subunit
LHEEARRVLATLHLEIPVEQSVRGLGVAACQLVEIARALSFDSRVLVLDEPSAVLTPHELVRLFEIVRGLRARGVAVLYISHRLRKSSRSPTG